MDRSVPYESCNHNEQDAVWVSTEHAQHSFRGRFLYVQQIIVHEFNENAYLSMLCLLATLTEVQLTLWDLYIQGNVEHNYCINSQKRIFRLSRKRLEEILNDLCEECMTVGLTMNTEVLTNDAEGQMISNNANIEFVTQYIYLDQTISFQNSMDKEIDRRIASAWKKFWSLSFILMDKSQKLQNKRQIFNSCIAPVLLYGAKS
ncbi:hypothetical protein ANN_21972 [Periplaneta americana]|uniref:Uncharacterized protein n=1 Tax=Periplaneta americana TaxID=6978 RepID=A0ABQ8S741_PERAM|nr:hypothetical protein ANN_21972 [Periplaneta americana]